jgi:hypothetical protein
MSLLDKLNTIKNYQKREDEKWGGENACPTAERPLLQHQVFSLQRATLPRFPSSTLTAVALLRGLCTLVRFSETSTAYIAANMHDCLPPTDKPRGAVVHLWLWLWFWLWFRSCHDEFLPLHP